MLQKVHTLKPRQLRAECERLGLDTTTLVEKKDFRRALLSHALQSVPTATLRALRDQHGFADIVNKTDIIRQLVQLFDSQPNLATNATATAHKNVGKANYNRERKMQSAKQCLMTVDNLKQALLA